MRLGILSDTHGDATLMGYALRALHQRGASFIIHCGDVGPTNVLDLFTTYGIPAAFVFGNTDVQREQMKRRAGVIGVTCFGEFGEFEMAGKKFAVLHGDDPRRLEEVVHQAGHDVVLHGHTHRWRDDWVNAEGKRPVRIINPGALHEPKNILDGMRAKTCAMLHLNTGRLEKIVVGMAGA
jgi:uncharacterized protein